MTMRWTCIVLMKVSGILLATKVTRQSSWSNLKNTNDIKSVLLLIFDISNTLITTKIWLFYSSFFPSTFFLWESPEEISDISQDKFIFIAQFNNKVIRYSNAAENRRIFNLDLNKLSLNWHYLLNPISFVNNLLY